MTDVSRDMVRSAAEAIVFESIEVGRRGGRRSVNRHSAGSADQKGALQAPLTGPTALWRFAWLR